MATNGQYQNGPFTGADYAHTGAPGTPGEPADTPGADLMTTPLTMNYQSSQLPVPRVDVDTGDTARPSSLADSFNANNDVIHTGAGMGSGHTVHPNSMSRTPR